MCPSSFFFIGLIYGKEPEWDGHYFLFARSSRVVSRKNAPAAQTGILRIIRFTGREGGDRISFCHEIAPTFFFFLLDLLVRDAFGVAECLRDTTF